MLFRHVLPRRLVAGVLTATAVLAGLTLVRAEPASASPASCAPGSNNGFTQIPYNKVGNPADLDTNPVLLYGSPSDGVLVRLEYDTLTGPLEGELGIWARLYHTGPPLTERDQVWLDWRSGPWSTTWLQCGPFAAGGKQTMTTPAKIDPSLWDEFRACAKLLGEEAQCTDWWQASTVED